MIHTYIHTYMHTCIHTHIHTYIHTQTSSNISNLTVFPQITSMVSVRQDLQAIFFPILLIPGHPLLGMVNHSSSLLISLRHLTASGIRLCKTQLLIFSSSNTPSNYPIIFEENEILYLDSINILRPLNISQHVLEGPYCPNCYASLKKIWGSLSV